MVRTSRRLFVRSALVSVLSVSLLSGCTLEASTDASPPSTATSAPKTQFADLMGSCMRESGWDVTITADLSIFPSDVENGLPAGQLDQYSNDLHTCLSETGFDAPSNPTDSQLEDLYEGDALARQCLIDEGHPIPEMPSKATYVSAYGTIDAWDVQEYVTLSSQAEYDKLYAICPLPAWSTNW
jgi:hypothetical protein